MQTRLTMNIAQKRLGQVSGHLAGSQSYIAPTEGDSGRAKLLEKHPDDVRFIIIPQIIS